MGRGGLNPPYPATQPITTLTHHTKRTFAMKPLIKNHIQTFYLKTKGYDVLRFWNHDVLQSMEEVLGEILRRLEKG